MMKKFYFACSFLFLALPFVADAQVYIQSTMFTFNKFVYNPAYAGASGYTQINSMFRAQWRNIPGAPTTFTVGADAPVAKIRGGVGGYFINDRLGYLATSGANVGYAFRTALGDPEDESTPTLAIGAQLGVLQKSLNGTIILDRNGLPDPIIPQGQFSQSTIVPNLGAGIYFSGPQDRYYAGASVQDILEPSLQGLVLATAPNVKARVPRSYYVMGGYTFNLTNDREHNITLQPNVMFKTDGRASQFDVNALLNVKPIVVGVGYRGIGNAADLMGIAGFNVSDRFFFGYSYDYALSGLQASRDVHTHEVVLTYRFPQTENVRNKVINIFDK